MVIHWLWIIKSQFYCCQEAAFVLAFNYKELPAMMSLTKREQDDLRSQLDKSVQKLLGFSEPTLVSAALDCLDRGYDKRKTIDKLSAILDSSQATSFAERIFEAWDEYHSNSKNKRTKRKKTAEPLVEEIPAPVEEVKEPKKKRRFMDDESTAIPVPGQPSPGQLTTDKIKEMMATAQRMIQERKAQLSIPLTPYTQQVHQSNLMNDAMDKARRVIELQAQIQSRLTNNTFLNSQSGKLPAFMPTPLILNDQGQTIDIHTGQAIQLQHHTPTLKANIRAKRREQFKGLIEKPPEEISDSKYYDPRVAAKAAGRQKRSFKFHDKGKFEQLAQRLRTKAQLDRLQTEIASAAKKTGIASAAKLATIAPKKEIREGEIPDIEWWDSYIVQEESYDDVNDAREIEAKCLETITSLVEHPIQIEPPGESKQEITISAYLTKKERKKLRRQNRAEAQRDMQEKIRIGLLPQPEPKVRLGNMMRVLESEAVQDPTKVEAYVRKQMAERLRNHEEANAARKLTPEQRRDKKIKKIQEDTTLGVHVSIYRVRDLHDQAKKFKIEKNAEQLFLTGIVVMYRDCSVVVVEGGPKQQRKFRHLMLDRIKWSEDKKHKKEEDDSDEEQKQVKENECRLVWEGMTKTRNFGDLKFKVCPTESFAREQFSKAGVGHYWDLVFSSVVLEEAAED